MENETPTVRLQLAEGGIEAALLGSFIAYPDTLISLIDSVRAEYFTDPVCVLIWDSVRRGFESGAEVSASYLMAALPGEAELGLPRQRVVMRLVDAAVAPAAVAGLVFILKDRWARRAVSEAGRAIADAAPLSNASPFELAQWALGELDEVNAAKSPRQAVGIGDAVAALQAGLDNPEALKGFKTGLRALDVKLNGYVPGQYYVVAARPGMGKSAYLCQSAPAAARAGLGVVVFSLEMGRVEIASRCISAGLRDTHAPGFGDIQRGMIFGPWIEAFAAAQAEFADMPIIIDDSPRLTVGEIAARARKYAAEFARRGIRLAEIWIDHIGLVAPTGRYAGNKVAETTEVSNGLRVLAKDLDACVIALCQLSRAVEQRDNKRPELADLRWSGDIEQDAHVVAFLYREYYYRQHEPNFDAMALAGMRHDLDFLIRKNRNGPPVDVRLWCSIEHSWIEDGIA